MTRVIVHIDRLVLRGFRYEDRLAIAEGLRSEISRLYQVDPAAAKTLASAGLGRDNPQLRLNGLSIPPATKPDQVGAQLGSQVALGLTQWLKP
jgi:hypothetical protein